MYSFLLLAHLPVLIHEVQYGIQVESDDFLLFSRNNLTVFDMKTVQGHGAKELLRVGGKLPGPGASLRFNVPQSTLMECRDGESTFVRHV